ncbi:MAG: SHOCT domain-containing protein [Nitrososphaeraceae archaeon]
MSFIKNVIKDRSEKCGRCGQSVGIRAHEPDTTWEFTGRLCNTCHQYVVASIRQYDVKFRGFDLSLKIEGVMSVYLFDKKNTIIFRPKGGDDIIKVTQEMLLNCTIITKEEPSMAKTLLTAGLSKLKEKKYLQIELRSEDKNKFMYFDVDDRLESLQQIISLLIPGNQLQEIHTSESVLENDSCVLCNKKLGLLRYESREKKLDGHLCKECYEKESVDKKYRCTVCDLHPALFDFKASNMCDSCFTKRYGRTHLVATNAEYYGGHKAYLAGGFAIKYQVGRMYLTDSHLIFSKPENDQSKRWEIVIPLNSVRVDKWRIEEESRRKEVSGGGVGVLLGSGIGGGIGGGTIHDEGKAHHIVIPYIDENGIPQEPRFGVSSFRGKAIRQWSEKIYEQIVKTKKDILQNTNTKQQTGTPKTKEDDPLHVLKMRLAKGEITKEEFEDLRKMLE